MPTIGPMELIVVLAVALLILGPKRLPAAGRSLGQGMREFKQSITGESSAGRSSSAEPSSSDAGLRRGIDQR